MKFLFLLALFLYGALQITAKKTLKWGKITDGDELMFSYTYTKSRELPATIRLARFRVPGEGETEFHNITFISLDNRNDYNAYMKIINGGVGRSFVKLLVQYPEGVPADAVFTVRGIYDDNGPCKKQ